LPDLSPIPGARGRITAHRGACKFAPENTYAAAQLCADWGLAYVEIDVRTTKDGVLIVMHDSTLDRTTDGTGRVEDMTWEEISGLDAGSWFGPEFTGEPVPLLGEFIAWARGAGVRVYLDVKDADQRRLLEIVERHGMRDRVFFWARDRDWMRTLREIDPDIPLKVNRSESEEISLLVADFDPQIIEFDRSSLSRSHVADARDLGITTMLYTPDNDAELFRKGLDYGVDLFNIDHIDTFRAVQRERVDRR
jgi:glycerophosphoryl diester phosphodiesterase